jgi:hypothetical protein
MTAAMNPATYKLRISVGIKLMLVIVPVFIVGAFLLMFATVSRSEDPPPRGFLVLTFGVVAWSFYGYLKIPHTITVLPDQRIRFKSLIHTVTIGPREIESIRSTSQFGFLQLRHTGGKLTLLNQFDGLRHFLNDLEAANPKVELRGV